MQAADQTIQRIGKRFMKQKKKQKLKSAGWEVGHASDFLGLSDEEIAIVEFKIVLAKGIQTRRAQRNLTQESLAELLNSSQSRVAKMEAADSSVTIDLLLRSLFALGATRKEVAKLMASSAA